MRLLFLLLQVITDSGYEEDHFVSNVKIGLGTLTCAAASYAALVLLSLCQEASLATYILLTLNERPCTYCKSRATRNPADVQP